MKNFFIFFKEKLKQPTFRTVFVGVLCLLIGLLIAWVIWPVQWTNATPEALREDYRIDYLRNTMVTYGITGDATKAQESWASLGDMQVDTIKALAAQPGFINQELIDRFTKAVNAQSVQSAVPSNGVIVLENGQSLGSAPQKEENKLKSVLLWVSLILFLIIATGILLFYRMVIRPQRVERGNELDDNTSERKVFTSEAGYEQNHYQPTPQPRPQPKPRPNPVNYRPHQNDQQPYESYACAYLYGDDLFANTFTFESPNGTYIGECGLNISETIGVGDPKKICAFELWLFDRNDVQTVTKILCSHHAFNDPELSEHLEARGDLVEVEPGKLFSLDSETLHLEVRVIEMEYGQFPLPPESYFQRLAVELSVYPR